MLFKNKKYIYNLLLFVFLLFTLNDLIDMHIRIIFDVDISTTLNSSGQTAQAHSKVKPAKKDKNPNNTTGHKIHFVNSENQNKNGFILLDEIACKDLFANISKPFYTKLIGRAPPISNIILA